MPSFLDRVKRGWNAFFNNRDPTLTAPYAGGSWSRPDRFRYSYGNAKSIIASIYNRIALDAALISIQHIQLDDQGRVSKVRNSYLNRALTLSANVDQTGFQLRLDAVASLFDEGCVAIVPTDTTDNPYTTEAYDIKELRVGKVLSWKPDFVTVELYNEITGQKEQLTVAKKFVALVENPYYAVMNETNSTMKRLTRKMNLLDAIDDQSSAGKMDLIIQLPYSIKSEGKRILAENRRKDIEMQLTGSKYGIAYIDGTEHITQLNRPVDNNLMKQIEYLTQLLMSQLGITEEIMNGTADEKTMTNYYSRTIEPIMEAFVNEMNRKFISRTAWSQGQRIRYFQNPFRLIPVGQIADLADKLTRNEILSSNEVRGLIGFMPVDDPMADQLKNSNINAGADQQFASTTGQNMTEGSVNIQNGA